MSSPAKAKMDKSKAKGKGNAGKEGGGSSAVCSQCGRSDCQNSQQSSSSNPTACKPPEQWTNKETNQMRDIHNENRRREQERKDKIAEEEAKRKAKEEGKNAIFGIYTKSGSSDTQPSIRQPVINPSFNSIPQPPSVSKKNKAEKGNKNDASSKKPELKASSTKKLEKEAGDAKKAKDAGNAKKAKDEGDAKKAKDAGDAKKAKDEGDAKKAKDEGDAKKAKDEGDAKKAKDEGDAKKAKDEGDAKKAKDEGDAKKAEAEILTMADDQYEIIKDLGSGSFGTVKLVKKGDKLYAYKKVEKSGNQNSAFNIIKSNHEIFLLQSILHPHVIRLYSFCSTSEAIHLIMDFCKYGDMYSLIMKQKQKNLSFTESSLLVFTLQIIAGLDFIHSKSIIHRDLKPENVLIQDAYHLKLGDFGAAKSLSMGARAGTTVGTLGYMAPEIDSHNYTYLADSYALGVTLYNLITFDFGSKSFPLQNYKLEDFEKMTRQLQGYLQKFSPMILRLLAPTEAKRMSVFEARVELRKIYTCSELKKHLNSLQMDPDTRDADIKFFEETLVPIKIEPNEVNVANFGDVITLKIINSSPQKFVFASTVTNKHCYTLHHQYGYLEAFGTAAFVLERQNNPCLDKDILSIFLKEYKDAEEIIPILGHRNSKGQEHVLQVSLIVLPY